MSLCANCQAFDLYSFPKDPGHTRCYLAKEVEDAAAAACPFCLLLFGELETQMQEAKSRFGKRYEQDIWVHLGMRNSWDRRWELETVSLKQKNLTPVEFTGPHYDELRIALGRLFDQPVRFGFSWSPKIFRLVADAGT